MLPPYHFNLYVFFYIVNIYSISILLFFIKLTFQGFEPGLATLKVKHVTTEPLQFTRRLFYLVNMFMIYIIKGYPKPIRNWWYPTRNPNQNLPNIYWVENSFIRKNRTRMDLTRTCSEYPKSRAQDQYRSVLLYKRQTDFYS